jgi:hypothetical protein
MDESDISLEFGFTVRALRVFGTVVATVLARDAAGVASFLAGLALLAVAEDDSAAEFTLLFTAVWAGLGTAFAADFDVTAALSAGLAAGAFSGSFSSA